MFLLIVGKLDGFQLFGFRSSGLLKCRQAGRVDLVKWLNLKDEDHSSVFILAEGILLKAVRLCGKVQSFI